MDSPLLAVPISNGLPKLGKLDRDIFFAAFIATTLSTVFLFHRAWAAAFTAVVALAFLVLWYGLPLRAAHSDRRR